MTAFLSLDCIMGLLYRKPQRQKMVKGILRTANTSKTKPHPHRPAAMKRLPRPED